MAPILHCVRHAQGFHNLDPRNEESLSDPPLTKRGRDQCARLAKDFPYHDDIDLVISSPLRRTIETTLLGFGKLIQERQLKVLLEARCQETSSKASDTGSEASLLIDDFGDVLDITRLEDGWNKNEGRWEMTDKNLKLHCDELREFISGLPQKNVLMVAHGSVCSFLENAHREDADSS
jgi:broad specificity phosphatase PhoE